MASTKAWRCVKKQQSFLETLFYKIPDSLVNPSIEYINPPYTEQELSAENLVADDGLKNDLFTLRKLLNSDLLNTILLNSQNIQTADLTEIEKLFQLSSKNMKAVVAELRAFSPKTNNAAILKTQIAYKLSLTQLNHAEMAKLFRDASAKIAESDALLAKPKDQLKLH